MSDFGPVDFGKTAADYANFRAGFPPELFARLDAGFAIGRPGQDLLDLACGTGGFARGFARRGARVVGLDRSEPMLAEAARLDRSEGLDVKYVAGRAEDTGLEAGAFDVVGCGQAWHWLERDRAAKEALRLLRPGGALVIAYLDWITLPGSVGDASESLLERLNPKWTWRDFAAGNLRWLDDAARAGFTSREAFAFDVELPYTHEAWRGRMRACSGVGASLPPDEVEAFDRAHQELLRARFPDPFLVPHRAFAIVAR